jgi:hypothetical protein
VKNSRTNGSEATMPRPRVARASMDVIRIRYIGVIGWILMDFCCIVGVLELMLVLLQAKFLQYSNRSLHRR